jgi:hypothetical protein
VALQALSKDKLVSGHHICATTRAESDLQTYCLPEHIVDQKSGICTVSIEVIALP